MQLLLLNWLEVNLLCGFGGKFWVQIDRQIDGQTCGQTR